MIWTETAVRNELPQVRVKDVYGHTSIADVKGRLLKYAILVMPNGTRVEVSWSAVAWCLTNDRPVLV